MDNDESRDREPVARVLLLAVLACASLTIPFLIGDDWSSASDLLTGPQQATVLCLFASGLLIGAIWPSHATRFALKLAFMTAGGNAAIALWHCPG